MIPRSNSTTDPVTVTGAQSSRSAQRPAESYVLRVTEGPDRGASFVVRSADPGAVVGQSAVCALRLSDRLVSRRHITLEVTERGLRVTDDGSTNGTTINGALIVTAFAREGDIIRLGETSLHVESKRAAGPPLSDEIRFGRLVGSSPAMRRLYPLCERLAASSVSVIVEGETGTGKELLAEVLHEASPRAKGPFVVFDCTAVPPNLVESMLMGHEKGAFTTALSARRGVLEQADGGTLLIDEIGDLDISLQPKLLRVLEQGTVQRLGSERSIAVDVRVLAATRRNLELEIQEGRFRDDLFYRLAVARIELPPLRHRKEDIALLARHFWRRLGGDHIPLPSEVLGRFESYAWPGNVRELRNAVARHLALGDLAGDSEASPLRAGPPSQPSIGAPSEPFEEVLALDLALPRARERIVQMFETRYVERVLARHGGNVTRAAAASGIARRSFYSVISRNETRSDK